MYQQIERRPIKARSARWPLKMATTLVCIGITPNQVSVLSTIFALIGAVLYLVSAQVSGTGVILSFFGAAVCIQLRLLCNMLDGLMAVECDRVSKYGDLFNELPDRISDVLLLVAAGYAAKSGELGITLGWSAALLAVTTAYLRAFGARYLKVQDYSGPMAKPHRMFALTVGSALTCLQYLYSGQVSMILLTLVILAVGTAITCIKRTVRIAQTLEREPC